MLQSDPYSDFRLDPDPYKTKTNQKQKEWQTFSLFGWTAMEKMRSGVTYTGRERKHITLWSLILSEKQKLLIRVGVIHSVVDPEPDPDTYSGALWIRIRIQNTDPDPHM